MVATVMRLLLSQPKHEPTQRSVAGNDADHDADPLARLALAVAILFEHSGSLDLALVREWAVH